MPGRGIWAAGTAALRALTHAAAQELRGEGIHVALLIVDGTIESPKTAGLTRDTPRDALVDQARSPGPSNTSLARASAGSLTSSRSPPAGRPAGCPDGQLRSSNWPTSCSRRSAWPASSWAEAAISWVVALVCLRGGGDLLGRGRGGLGHRGDVAEIAAHRAARPSRCARSTAAISPTWASTSPMPSRIAANAPLACSTVATPSSVRRAPSSTTSTARAVSAWISPISVGDRAGGLLGLLGELADLFGHDGEAAALLAGARGLDGGVEREQVGLLGDAGDRRRRSRRSAPSACRARGSPRSPRGWRRARRPSPRSRCRPRRCPPAPSRACSAACTVPAARSAPSPAASATSSPRAQRGLDGAHLALGALGDVAHGAGDLADGAAGLLGGGGELPDAPVRLPGGAGRPRRPSRAVARSCRAERAAEHVALGARLDVARQVAVGDRLGDRPPSRAASRPSRRTRRPCGRSRRRCGRSTMTSRSPSAIRSAAAATSATGRLSRDAMNSTSAPATSSSASTPTRISVVRRLLTPARTSSFGRDRDEAPAAGLDGA